MSSCCVCDCVAPGYTPNNPTRCAVCGRTIPAEKRMDIVVIKEKPKGELLSKNK